MRKLTKRRSVRVRILTSTAAFALAMVLAACGATAGPGNHQSQEGQPPRASVPPDETVPVGGDLPSEEPCVARASQYGSDREARPENTIANASEPKDLRLPPWPTWWDEDANKKFVLRINGHFAGTTDQILVWGACKWGINSDVVRAMAMEESSWRQAKLGDYEDDPKLCVGGYSVPCPTSFGILQLKHYARPGSYPYSQRSTAFNVDYTLATLRGCFEGWVLYLGNGYSPGDLWGCVGWHYSGEWKDKEAQDYVVRVKSRLADHEWTDW
jgi:hypothetical protein